MQSITIVTYAVHMYVLYARYNCVVHELCIYIYTVGGNGHVPVGPRPQDHPVVGQAGGMRPRMVRAQRQTPLYPRLTPTDIMKERLNRLGQQQPAHIGMPSPIYPGHMTMPSGMSMPSYHQQIKAFQQYEQQRKLQIIRMQQQQKVISGKPLCSNRLIQQCTIESS